MQQLQVKRYVFWLCLEMRVRRTLKWCIDELIKHIEFSSTDVECRFLISACLSVLKLLCSVWVEPSGTEHVSGEHSSTSPRYGTCQHRGCLRSCSKPWINSVCSTPCLKKLGRHFRPVWTLLPFILNGELDPVSALCVQAVVLPWRSLWGELFRTPTDTHSRSSFHVSHLFINISQFCDQSSPLWAPVWLIALADIHCIVGSVCPLQLADCGICN